MTLEEQVADLQLALANIIAHVERGRPRGWHLYPTKLRDEAVHVLCQTGYPVKTYQQYERETDASYEKGGANG